MAFGDDIRLKSVFEFRNKNFNDAPDRPLSRGLTGSDKLFSLFVSKPITAAPASELALEFDFLAQDTRLAYYSNKTFAGSVAYRIRYDDPTRLSPFSVGDHVFRQPQLGQLRRPRPVLQYQQQSAGVRPRRTFR